MTIVTADALNCQKDTVSALSGSKEDYVLALKGNQPLFYKENWKGYKKTIEKGHGGIALKKCYITEDMDQYAGREQWDKLNQTLLGA